MKTVLPTATFITATLNSESTIRECIESVKRLSYPKKLVQMYLMDGGSKDKTVSIAREYSICKVFVVKGKGSEEATAMGYNKATSDYVVNLASDNVIPNKKWLHEMLNPLEVDKKLVASESLNYHYKKSDKLLNRYFALFGMNDPVALYLDKCDRRTHYESGWHLPTAAVNHGSYYETVFDKENMPTLGANGFVVRTKIIKRVTKNVAKFSHIDSCIDLLNLGYCRYAFVKTTLWHKSGESFFNYFYKRRKYALELYFKKQHNRRYHLYYPYKDRLKLIRYISYSLTGLEPLIRSIRGYSKIRDTAWFLHPIICFLTTINYFLVVTKFRVHKVTGRY